MSRPGRIIVVAGVILVTAVLATSLVLASFNHSISPKGPQLPAHQLEFNQPTMGYAWPWTWYNFTILSVIGDFSWNQTTVVVFNGTLWPLDSNSSLTLVDLDKGYIVPFTLSASFTASERNWTTTNSTAIADGQILSLKVDHPQTGGGFNVVWSGPPKSAWGFGPLP